MCTNTREPKVARVRVHADACKQARSLEMAAGATWSIVTASAPWGVRYDHTSVIDAGGAIYVIGGQGNAPTYNDVWVSTDKGADRNRAGTPGHTNGY